MKLFKRDHQGKASIFPNASFPGAVCFYLSLLATFAHGEALPPSPPNVLIFLMDDMGIGDCRVYNSESKVSLPNLEKLAEQGIRFTDAHSPSAVCAPTRYSVMTGNYPWRGRKENGTWLFNMPSQILPGQKTIGQLMKDAGYQTAFLGKVHLGGKPFSKKTGKPKFDMKGGFEDFDFSRKIEDTPASLGFDYAYELPQGIQGSPYIALENGILVGGSRNLREWKKGTYGKSIIEADGFGSADWDSSIAGPILTERAISFLDGHFSENEKSGIRKPFFMHYCSQSCHVPHTPPEELGGKPVEGASIDAHLDMIVEADLTLGKMIAKLREAQELENTLIIFTSDNGGLSRGAPSKPKGGHNSNAGFRGSKAQIYEGGHRVPFIARWGNGKNGSPIQPNTTCDALIGLQDLFATLAELTTQPMDVRHGLDSQSFLELMRGIKGAKRRKSILAQANNGTFNGQQSKKMLREDSWKLIATKELIPIEMYNLEKDPMESVNLIGDILQEKRVKRMQGKLEKVMQSQRSTLPYSISRQKTAAVHSHELFAPRANLLAKMKRIEGGKAIKWGRKFKIIGQSPVSLSFVPEDKLLWDASGYKLIAMPVQNWTEGVTTIEGRLNNGQLTSWSRHAVGFAVVPSWEKTTLGFPFPMVEDRYKGPALFHDQLARPNGHRIHWRRFFPEDLREITLDIASSTGKVDLLIHPPFLAWPDSDGLNKALETLPYLDELGQVRSVDWPGKAKSIIEGRKIITEQLKNAKVQAKQRKLSRYGGWIDGPKQKGTGRFRTEKVGDKWWLIDPEGYLFFSVGACLTGHRAETSAEPKRENGNFFSYLPDSKDYLRWTGLRKVGGKQFVNFPAMNYQRYFGEEWKTTINQGIHDRNRAWGLNTLGCWSDETLQKEGKTPYVLISSIWWQESGHRKFPSPFRSDFQADLEKSLKKLAWAKDDPFCLGIFIGNELEWPDRLGQTILKMPPEHPTKKWALLELHKKGKSTSPALAKDLDDLYLPFVQTFFSKCKNAVENILPRTLYLGCRTHRGPSVLGKGALGAVDVFSVNVYDSKVRSWQVPPGADIPILASEFHFGAVDRGVPSPGLSGAWDQRQRALSFAHYLASALSDPRFVGVHWFQWIDQPASGRKDRENHQCGFIDVAGRAYPEFIKVVSQATRAMYPVRSKGKTSTLDMLQVLIKD